MWFTEFNEKKKKKFILFPRKYCVFHAFYIRFENIFMNFLRVKIMVQNLFY